MSVFKSAFNVVKSASCLAYETAVEKAVELKAKVEVKSSGLASKLDHVTEVIESYRKK